VDVFGTDYPTPDGTCIRDYILRARGGFVSCTLVIAERDVGRSLDIDPMI